MRRFFAAFQQERILGGAFVLALTQFAASVAGLIRDRMLAQTFPGLDTVDVYIAAFRPSDLLFQISIMAGLSTVMVPLLARYRSRDDAQQMSSLLSSVMAAGSLGFGVLALGLAFALPVLAPFLVRFEGPSLELYVTFGRLALLTNFLFVLGNSLGQYLVTVQRYWIYGLTPVLYTVGTIAGTLFLTPVYGPLGPMIGTLGGAAVYVLLRFAGAIHAGLRVSFRFLHPDLLTMGWLMLPRMAALGALQLQLLLFDSIASGLPAGSVTINAYARNFQSVAVGVIGIALAQSVFSPLSQAAARSDRKIFHSYLGKGTTFLILATVLSSILLSLLAPVAAWLVHLQGVLPLFSVVLTIYALSIPFESLNHLYQRAFFALHSTTIPAVLSVCTGFIAIVISYVLAGRFGVASLALGFAVGQLLQMIGLWMLLPRKMRALAQ